MSSSRFCFFILMALAGVIDPGFAQEPAPAQSPWPSVTSETKPWTRWWWHGSAVTPEGITAELEALHAAGIGGVEITPIYGVYGFEDKFINFLSPEWIDMLVHTLKEGERLGLGIDMATGTGWPFGGPWVDADDACKNVYFKTFDLSEGKRLTEKILFVQDPYVRAIGNQIYEVHENAETERRVVQGSRKEPLMQEKKKPIVIEDLVEPIASNKDLQALALDQVQFGKQLPLQTLMAYNNAGEKLDLTSKVAADGTLEWKAGKGKWKLYAVFQGWHGKMVERAGPGGEGNVIDHFSKEALVHYLSKFDSAFAAYDIRSLRAFFNDSYEVDDARGTANWTPLLFDTFVSLHQYDLRHHLPALFGHDSPEKNERVLSDYRHTLSEMLLTNFTQQWKQWAFSREALVRNQAHGSPSNILDLYATVDIPEIEGIEPLRIKMASSAGNVSGKRLISSESATWLNEHFRSNLADIKVAVDRFLLHGVNHVFYHGTSYSPKTEPWPGWLFYAAVHLNTRNPLWNDFAVLNQYIERCQSFLQNTKSDNDVLLYYPIQDVFAHRGNEMIEHFDGIGRQFEGTSFARCAEEMLKKGYAFDYISDKQIAGLRFEKELLATSAGTSYKTIIVPHCRYIPLETANALLQLIRDGAVVIFFEGMPETVSGFRNVEENKNALDKIRSQFESLQGSSGDRGKDDDGRVLEGDHIADLLTKAKIRREMLVESGLAYIRKKDDDNRVVYFINNVSDSDFQGRVKLQVAADHADIFDPLTGQTGRGDVRAGQNAIEVYVELQPEQSVIIRTNAQSGMGKPFPYYRTVAEAIAVPGPWQITFNSGGPALPRFITVDSLVSWTNFGDDSYKAFSGTASYAATFPKPAGNAAYWRLYPGIVKESAKVYLNGEYLATVLRSGQYVNFPASSLKDRNELKFVVSNLMANRIAAMEKKGAFWKKFYNVNFPARLAENRKNGLFDASAWMPVESGLIGPVLIAPLEIK